MAQEGASAAFALWTPLSAFTARRRPLPQDSTRQRNFARTWTKRAGGCCGQNLMCFSLCCKGLARWARRRSARDCKPRPQWESASHTGGLITRRPPRRPRGGRPFYARLRLVTTLSLKLHFHQRQVTIREGERSVLARNTKAVAQDRRNHLSMHRVSGKAKLRLLWHDLEGRRPRNLKIANR